MQGHNSSSSVGQGLLSVEKMEESRDTDSAVEPTLSEEPTSPPQHQPQPQECPHSHSGPISSDQRPRDDASNLEPAVQLWRRRRQRQRQQQRRRRLQRQAQMTDRDPLHIIYHLQNQNHESRVAFQRELLRIQDDCIRIAREILRMQDLCIWIAKVVKEILDVLRDYMSV